MKLDLKKFLRKEFYLNEEFQTRKDKGDAKSGIPTIRRPRNELQQ